MKMPNTTRVSSAVLAIVLVGCGGQAAPSKPTWEAEVFPILQGRCLGCHGSTAASTGGGSFRFDFFDTSKCGKDFDFAGSAGFGLRQTILADVVPQEVTEGDKVKKTFRPRMPPAPANLLEDWEVQTLRNWAKYADKDKEKARGGEGRRNRDPKIRITSELPSSVGDSLNVSYVIEDADDDPVIGILRLGDKEIELNGQRGGEVTFEDIGGDSGDELTISADLCDGWERVNVEDLGTVEKE